MEGRPGAGNSLGARMNYMLDLLGPGNGWQKFFFGLKRFVPDGVWPQNLLGGRDHSVAWLFNHLYPQGVVAVAEHDPHGRDLEAERRISTAQLEARAGGLLGLIRIKEVAIGTTQLAESGARWRDLLHPAIEETVFCWQVGDGPALRLIAAERDELHHMVWEVASLPYARAALAARGLLGTTRPDELTIDAASCFGVDIRLVEAPGGFVGG
jgi:hypothetical protein